MQDTTRKVTAQHAHDVIKSTWAVIKMVSSPISPSVDNRSWKLIIDGLNEPHTHRFVKPLKSNINRERRFNPQTTEWEYRKPHPQRGRDKTTEFTKKTALTLLPARANITLFAPRYGTPIGLLLDWRLCHRKGDRYVFAKNVVSDNKPWLARTDKPMYEQPLTIGIPLQGLQEKLRQLGPRETAEQNELLGGLHRNAVLAVIAPENTLFVRLNALAKKNLMLHNAQMDLPILIFDSQMGILEYTAEMQHEDIAEILRSPYPSHIKTLAESCINPYEMILLHNAHIKPSAPPLELLESEDVIPEQSVFNGNIPKDVRRRILLNMGFFSLVLLRQQIPNNAELGLLQLKADITFVIKKIGPFVLSQMLEIKAEHIGLSYQRLLPLYLPALKQLWDKALSSRKKLPLAFRPLPHLVLAHSAHLEGTIQAYALEGKSEQDTWGESEIKYHDVGLHFRNNFLLIALTHFSTDTLQQLITLYPAWAQSTFASLQIMYAFVLKYPHSHKYKLHVDPKDISQKWKAFVTIAPRELLMGTLLDPILRKTTLDVILDKIVLTTSLDDLHKIYTNYAHSPWFAAPRHPTWDNVCSLFHPKRSLGCPAYPDAQRDIIFLLQKRAFDILTHAHCSTADIQTVLDSPLFDRVHIRRGVSDEMVLQLNRLQPKSPVTATAELSDHSSLKRK